MRPFTTSCLAILLFSAVAFARLGTSAAPNRLLQAVPTPADVTNFLTGLWNAIGLGHEFDDFSTCITQDNDAGTQLQKAMTLMASSSASDVSKGLNKLQKIVSPLVDGLKACNMSDKYSKNFNQIVKNFTNAETLNVKTGVSLLVNDIEVNAEVTAAVVAFNSSEFNDCGDSIGDAMGKVFYSQGKQNATAEAAQINAILNLSWVASNSTGIDGTNLWKFKKNHVGLRRQKNKKIPDAEKDSERRNLATIPAAFDARTQWPTCIHAIRDQGGCGSCWAFAATEVLSDRFCIVSNKSTNVVLSPQYLVSCDTGDAGCNGGDPYTSWKFLERTGDLSDTCAPYTSLNGVVAACSNYRRCADGSTLRKYYAKVNSTRWFSTIPAIQTEIQTNGPVEAAMDIYSDFLYYKSGIYSNTPNAQYLGGHAIKVVGWGNTNGTNYWIVANSWGTSWGESGYFRIKMGSCDMEYCVYSATPDLTRQ